MRQIQSEGHTTECITVQDVWKRKTYWGAITDWRRAGVVSYMQDIF
jgi:hypothetical protein